MWALTKNNAETAYKCRCHCGINQKKKRKKCRRWPQTGGRVSVCLSCVSSVCLCIQLDKFTCAPRAHNEAATAAAGRPAWAFHWTMVTRRYSNSFFYSFSLPGLLKAHIWALNVLGKYVLNGKTCKGCFTV